LLAALARQERWGIGQVVMNGRKILVIVRPDRGALQMACLHHAAAIQQPSAFVKDLPHIGPADKTAQLAEELVENWTDEKFDFSHYVDRYGQEVRKLIEAKVHGREIVAPEEEPAVYNLMDALRKSMEHNKAIAHKNGHASGTNGKSHGHRAARSRTNRRGHRRAS